ncbi:MAG TPA: ribonuclease III [Candidatus Anaerobiospirillum stercoravium]|nr:ribonuclease III [Candidatus Anaerobiospirillum stercoravium]
MINDSSFLHRIQHLEQTIGYSFQNIALLEQALTHRSFGPHHNERLEFLGDSILGMIIAKELFAQFPDSPEGDLTRMRSVLVRETTLAELAREFKIGDCLLLGPGELKSGGSRRDSLLADAVESIIGAIFLDSNEHFEIVRQLVLTWFRERLRAINPSVSQKDPKSALQEYLQSQHKELPIYRIENIIGTDNNQVFEVSVVIQDIKQVFHGRGSSRRRAEQKAASIVLDYLQTHPLS